MKTQEAYKTALINEIESLKPLLIQMGFDYPLEANINENSIELLEEFYSEINGYISLHNFKYYNYPHTSGR
jgi:hypothetical protein